MRTMKCDVLIIGAGPGGLAAAKAAKEAGAAKVIVLERDEKAGGILNQCIHDGFGLVRYQEALTGPEYASRALIEVMLAGVEILTGRHVKSISSDKTVSAYSIEGIEQYHASTVVLATGCRERTRGAISIPGSRPAGVFTAGVAQNLVNFRNVMIGKRVVIFGSGDIGLIMARRLTLEGAKVLAVAEIMPEPCGLARNVSQCVYEYDIPLYVNTTVSRIIGKRKLEAVELSKVDGNKKPISGTEKRIECDALVLSVGLIPENEVAQTVGVKLNADNSVTTDEFLQTSVTGIFSCGNSRHVMDLADYVSEQGEVAGRNAVHLIMDKPMESWDEEKSNCMKKGFPEKDTVTCTICPNGCQVRWDEGSKSYSGNKCPKGAEFAEQERTEPKRTVTTAVKSNVGSRSLIPVRSFEPVLRKNVMRVVNYARRIVLESNVIAGEEVVEVDCGDEKVKLVAVDGTNID